MEIAPNPPASIIKAVHGLRTLIEDPTYELEFAETLRSKSSASQLHDLFARFSTSDSEFDQMMRRIIWHAAAKSVGHGLKVGTSVGFTHLDRCEFGDAVFIGAQTFFQASHVGTCIIGSHVWIGPQSYFDARNVVLEDYVGWGPGAKALCSTHTGLPTDVPIVQTDLSVKPIRICAWADIGTNAIIMPGITVGTRAIVGAGAVVTHDVEPFAIVAGVPAKFLRWRDEARAVLERAEENQHA
jgi:acetyltransferase-like isoleucine patch superfamily enzyme